MNLEDVISLARAGESETLELKSTSGQLPRVGETLCGFLNGSGGLVLIGVTSDGTVLGDAVSEDTLQGIANVLRRFEPPPPVRIERLPVSDGHEVIACRFPMTSMPCLLHTTGVRIAESAQRHR